MLGFELSEEQLHLLAGFRRRHELAGEDQTQGRSGALLLECPPVWTEIPTARQQVAIANIRARGGNIANRLRQFARRNSMPLSVVRAVVRHQAQLTRDPARTRYWYGERALRCPVRCASCRAMTVRLIVDVCPVCFEERA